VAKPEALLREQAKPLERPIDFVFCKFLNFSLMLQDKDIYII